MVPSIVVYVAAIAIILLVLKLLGKSLKMLIGVLINAIVGMVVFAILNALRSCSGV